MLPESATPLLATLKDAHAVILSQQARIANLESQVESLQKQLQELAEKMSSSSRTSSKPPSSDSPEQRALRPNRPKSSRHKGGHPRHERALLPEDQVDHIHSYFPENHCACGGSVAIAWLNPYRHQVIDLPPPPVEITEHRFLSRSLSILRLAPSQPLAGLGAEWALCDFVETQQNEKNTCHKGYCHSGHGDKYRDLGSGQGKGVRPLMVIRCIGLLDNKPLSDSTSTRSLLRVRVTFSF